MNTKQRAWTRRFDFSMLSFWLLLSFVLAGIAFFWYGVDFRVYYAAARVLLEGGNPYDYRLIAQALLDVTGEVGNNPYYYPPWFVWIFVPLAGLSFQVARAVWMAFNVILWNVSLWQLSQLIGWPSPGWKRYGLFALCTFSFAWITWRYEQAGILVFAILVNLILAIQKENDSNIGIILALLLIKPNITLIPATGIGIWLVRRREWRAIWVTLFVLIVLFLISTLITPDWYQPLFEEGYIQGLTVALDGPGQVLAIRINSTFLDWLRTLGISSPWNTLIYSIAICAGVIVFLGSVYSSQSITELVSILLLVSYAITPYALQYDYPSLAIPLFWALSRCAGSPKVFSIGFLLASFVFSVIFWQKNISWSYWMLVGSITLAVWTSLAAKSYSDEPVGNPNNL